LFPQNVVFALQIVVFALQIVVFALGDAAREKSCVTAVVVALTDVLAADCLPDAS